MDNPIEKFLNIWGKALKNSPLKHKSPVCISTVNAEGFPEGRFVDLKEVSENGFVICSCYNSNKGKQLLVNPRASLTMWWEHIDYQIRVVGNIQRTSTEDSEKFWESRSREAQLTTTSFNQSQLLASETELMNQFLDTTERVGENPIRKPESWGGYILLPNSIEFLKFNENRLHLRELYKFESGAWVKSLLQP